jgi:hypothetical protein
LWVGGTMKRNIQWWHVAGDVSNVVIAGFILAATASSLAGYKAARTAFLFGGFSLVPGALICFIKGNENEPIRLMEQAVSLERYAEQLSLQPAIAQPALMPSQLPAEAAASASAVPLYQWQNAVDDACGLIIAGQAGFGKSTLALWFLGLFTQNKAAKIKVLDPHGRINNWQDNGLNVIYDFDAIERELDAAIAELDRRRGLSKQELKNQPDFIYVADEVAACLDSFENPKTVSKALRRLGCEGRKYHVSLIAIAHSHNAEALGIDAKQRSNYLLVLLGDSARQVAGNIWKRESEEYQFIDSQAYPCLVSGSVKDMPAVHPTHGHHTIYKKEGNAPGRMLRINQITDTNSPKKEHSTISSLLEASYNLPGYIPTKQDRKEGDAQGKEFPGREIISPSGNDGEKWENQSGQEFPAPRENFSFFPKPDHNPSDGCAREGKWEKRKSFTQTEANLVLELTKKGESKTEIIKALGYPIGRAYKKGKEKYSKIKEYWESKGL